MKERLSVTVDSEYVDMIDNVRGLAGRSAVVNDILKREFAKGTPSAAQGVN